MLPGILAGAIISFSTLMGELSTTVMLYSAQWLGDITAINPDGTIAWSSSTATTAQSMLAVRQDVGRVMYVVGGFGTPNSVAGVNTADGTLAWTVDLRVVDGHNELSWTSIAPTSSRPPSRPMKTRAAR